MIYEVSRFGHYVLNNGKIAPGWQSHWLGADSPEEARAEALPVMDAHAGFTPSETPDVRPAKCFRHPRYTMQRPPSGNCGRCHAMWMASKQYVGQAPVAEGAKPAPTTERR